MSSFKKPRRLVRRVFIHCSASDNPKHDNVATMRRWHKARGWRDVGYHFFIRKDGNIEFGRDIELTPAAQLNKKRIPGFGQGNPATIAICCHGLEEDQFTEAQFKSLRLICRDINLAYGKTITFHGHKEIQAKACPVFDYKAVLKLDVKGNLGI